MFRVVICHIRARFIGARLVPSFVVRCRRQWCTHGDAHDPRLDGVVAEARVSRVELRIGDGAQDIEPLIQGRVIRMDVENRRGIEVPEVMVFGAADVGERFEVGGVGDDVGGAGKRSQGERHGAEC